MAKLQLGLTLERGLLVFRFWQRWQMLLLHHFAELQLLEEAFRDELADFERFVFVVC